MTLKEAIESGKPFRRPNWVSGWITCDKTEDYTFSYANLIATDYILKEEPKFLWAVNWAEDGWQLWEYTEKEVKENFTIGKTAIKIAEVSE